MFLDQPHTIAHMRQALSVPTLSDRDTYDEWYAKGQRSRVEIAREQVREILSDPPAPCRCQMACRAVAGRGVLVSHL